MYDDLLPDTLRLPALDAAIVRATLDALAPQLDPLRMSGPCRSCGTSAWACFASGPCCGGCDH